MSQTTCDPTAKAGTTKLAKLLVATYPGTSYGIGRACTTDTTAVSEHYEGRAVDWMNSVRVAKEAAQAAAVVKWLLATDQAGHTYANARRLGVMYVIWNNQIWGAYNADQGWRSYQDCANRPAASLDSVCHRNHIHISLTWAGAVGSTSYWTKSVAAVDYGPCRPADLNHAPSYSTKNPVKCRSYPKVVAPAGSSASFKALTKDSGKVLKVGTSGAVVKTVQTVVRVPADGKYGTQTAAAVKTWQTSHRLAATGTVEAATWRALLSPPPQVVAPRYNVEFRGSVRRGVR
jgi:peptidoglycan hydrolase-like protein with peptidoglycan-binding domain